MGKNKPVLVFDEHRDLISIVASIKEAGRMLGVTPRAVSNCCKGVSILCKGHYLRYLDSNIGLSLTDYFETLDLTPYDEIHGETRYYFTTKHDCSDGRKKIATDELRMLEENKRNKIVYQLNEYYAHNLKVLAQYGWFIEMNPDAYSSKMFETKLEEEKDIKVVVKALMKYYQTHLKKIIKEICGRYPKRSNYISVQIMSNYTQGHYDIAITGILTQVDGICSDKLKQYFFIKEKKGNYKHLPSIVGNLIRVRNDFYKVYIAPLLSDCPIYTYQSKIDEYPCKLNRHLIMHGKDTNYGSKENFLKSVSLLKYVSDILYYSDICIEYKKSFERYIYPHFYE